MGPKCHKVYVTTGYETGDVQFTTYSGTCTIFVNEFLTTTLKNVVVNNVETGREGTHSCVQCVTQHGTCVQSKGIKGNKCDF